MVTTTYMLAGYWMQWLTTKAHLFRGREYRGLWDGRILCRTSLFAFASATAEGRVTETAIRSGNFIGPNSPKYLAGAVLAS